MITDDARDPQIKWIWCKVGVLDYNNETNHYYVQKVNNKNRIIDEDGKPVVNGNMVQGKFVASRISVWPDGAFGNVKTS